jgi:hypothetical protein
VKQGEVDYERMSAEDDVQSAYSLDGSSGSSESIISE